MTMRRSLLAVAVCISCIAASPSPLPSALPSPSATPAPSTLDTQEYRLETDTITTHKNGDFEMPHHVAFSRPGSDGSADSAQGNEKNGTVTLIGNVVLHDNGNAPEATSSSDQYARGGPATLTCDRLDVDSKARTYVATGNVHFEQGARRATADHGTLNRTTGQLQLDGHVKTSDGSSSLSAEFVTYNLTSKQYEAHGSPIIIKQPVPSAAPAVASPTPAPKKKRRLPF